MHLAQKDLFWGMDIDFVKKITELAVNMSCRQGDTIFEVDDKADYFYMLLKGSVIMQRDKDQWHKANNPGELFGWSALINRDVYAASAMCTVDTELLKFERGPFLELLETSQRNKATLFEHFSKMLGNQLLEEYMSTSC